jgi:hypothetical protein
MKFPLWPVIVVATLTGACSLENTTKLLSPTAPGNAGGGSTSTTSTNTSTNTGTATPASAFTGAWGSSSIAGLPVGACADLKWLITEQSATSIAGNVTATCAGGATVAASLTGQTGSNGTMNLAATGTIVAMGIPCPFNLTGVGSPQANDQMKLDYTGSHCLGPVNGTETLRRFPIAL